MSANFNSDRRQGRLARVLMGLLFLVIIAGALALAVFTLGRVEGEEFSPDTFQRRSFSYYEVPLLHHRLSEVYHEKTSGELEKHLQTQPTLIPPTMNNNPRWDLVVQRSGKATTGDAAILVEYLEAQHADNTAATIGPGDYLWYQWTKDHPEYAKVLWPAIAKLARDDLYTMTPAVFETAKLYSFTDPKPPVESLVDAMDQTLSELYTQQGDLKRDLAEHRLAIQLYTTALSFNDSNIAAHEGRSLSHLALGQVNQANADRDKIEALKGNQPETETEDNPEAEVINIGPAGNAPAVEVPLRRPEEEIETFAPSP